MLTPEDVVQSSARRSIQRSLMMVVDLFTFQGASGNFVILRSDIPLLLLEETVSRWGGRVATDGE